jgi:tRNA-splicing ligase RtcB (3'-phosphate/5'-hydroxy nucleic acid ligase)
MGLAFARGGPQLQRNRRLRQHASKTEAAIVAEQITAIDARLFCGIPNVSEPPGAYKNAAAVSA